MLAASVIKELKLLSRDLHGVAVLFVMPVLFMLIMSAALSNDDQLNRSAGVVLLGETADPLNQNFLQALQDEGLNVQTAAADKLPEFQAALQEGRIDLIVQNPNTEKTALKDEQTLTLWLNPAADKAWILGIKGVLQQHYTQTRLDGHFGNTEKITIKRNGLPRSVVKKIETEVNDKTDERFEAINDYLGKTHWRETYLNRKGSEVAKPDSVQHSVPAWLIFGMFFIMIPLSNVMAAERHTNTLTRLRMARAPASSLLAGKFVPYFLINQLQFAGMIALGIWVLPQLNMPALQLSGSLLPYAALSCAVSLAALGYGLLVSVCTKTSEQAVVLGGGGIIIMAALGGIMVPVHIMPDVMQTIARFSPMNWGLSAFQNLLLNHYTLVQIQTPLLYLAAFGLLTLAAAGAVYRRQLHTQARF